MMEHESHFILIPVIYHSSVAVQPVLTHTPLLGYQECSFSRTFVSETQTEQEHQSLTILIHGTSQEPSWMHPGGSPICGSQVQEQPFALSSLKINIPGSLRIPGLRWFGVKVERAAHRSASVCQWGELLSQGKELYPICWLCLSLRNGQRGKSCYPVKYLQEQQTKQL